MEGTNMTKEELIEVLSEASRKIELVYQDHTFSEIVCADDVEKEKLGDALYDNIYDAMHSTNKVINLLKESK